MTGRKKTTCLYADLYMQEAWSWMHEFTRICEGNYNKTLVSSYLYHYLLQNMNSRNVPMELSRFATRNVDSEERILYGQEESSVFPQLRIIVTDKTSNNIN